MKLTVAKIAANSFLRYLRFLCVGSPSFLVISAPSNNELSVDVIVSVVAFARRFRVDALMIFFCLLTTLFRTLRSHCHDKRLSVSIRF